MSQAFNKHVKIGVPYKVKARKVGFYDLYEDMFITKDGEKSFNYSMEEYEGVYCDMTFTPQMKTIDTSSLTLPWRFDYNNTFKNNLTSLTPYNKFLDISEVNIIPSQLPSTMTSENAWVISNGVLQNGSKSVNVNNGISIGYFEYTPTTNSLLTVNGKISSEPSFDYGGVFVGKTLWTPTVSEIKSKKKVEDGEWVISDSGLKDVTGSCVLAGGEKYYIICCYAKDSSVNKNDDKFYINSIAVKPIQGCLYHYTDETEEAVTLGCYGANGSDQLILSDIDVVPSDLDLTSAPKFGEIFIPRHVMEMVTLTINPTPADATVTLTCEDYTQDGNSISVFAHKTVRYKIVKNGYKAQSGTLLMTKNETLNIELEEGSSGDREYIPGPYYPFGLIQTEGEHVYTGFDESLDSYMPNRIQVTSEHISPVSGEFIIKFKPHVQRNLPSIVCSFGYDMQLGFIHTPNMLYFGDVSYGFGFLLGPCVMHAWNWLKLTYDIELETVQIFLSTDGEEFSHVYTTALPPYFLEELEFEGISLGNVTYSPGGENMGFSGEIDMAGFRIIDEQGRFVWGHYADEEPLYPDTEGGEADEGLPAE